MRIFITGANGFVGSAIVRELIGAGHAVLGLARSDAAAASVAALGAEVHRGELADDESLRRGAASADCVIHTAFHHDRANPGSGRANFQASCDLDARAVRAMGDALVGSNKHLVVTSGTPSPTGRAALETDPPPTMIPRISEQTAHAFVDRGVRVTAVRLPRCVHVAGGPYGFTTVMMDIAARTGVSAYVGDGASRWCAVHRDDAARLYRIVVEKPATGTLHAIGEQGVPQRAIAEAIGKRLNLPVISLAPDKVADHFGTFAMFAQLDSLASSEVTQKALGWSPSGPGLIEDIVTDRATAH
ncbi:MAG: SDR family oxidoreductase [Kofleriaceae bacterium]